MPNLSDHPKYTSSMWPGRIMFPLQNVQFAWISHKKVLNLVCSRAASLHKNMGCACMRAWSSAWTLVWELTWCQSLVAHLLWGWRCCILDLVMFVWHLLARALLTNSQHRSIQGAHDNVCVISANMWCCQGSLWRGPNILETCLSVVDYVFVMLKVGFEDIPLLAFLVIQH